MSKARLPTLVVIAALLGSIVLSRALIEAAPSAAARTGAPGSLILFNRNMGCLCAIKMYQTADSQFGKIDPELARAFNARRVNMEELSSHAVGERYRVANCPTLVVLDANGREVLRQQTELDSAAIEAVLREMLTNGKGSPRAG